MFETLLFVVLLAAALVAVSCNGLIFVHRVKEDGFLKSLWGSTFFWAWRFIAGAMVMPDPEMETDRSRRQQTVKKALLVWAGSVGVLVLAIGALKLTAGA